MNPLSAEERAHCDAFNAARPDWHLCVIGERMHDEDHGNREHKYARAHPYVTGMRAVMHELRDLAPCRVLDIGSPIAQNVALACLPGIDLTVVDVRPHDDAEELGLKWTKATATDLPFETGSWGIVTSLWVMGHVGDGRYGDPFVVDGDLRMLREIARVLRPGGTAIIGVGLVADECGNIFNVHRVYSWPWLRKAFADASFDVVTERNMPVSGDIFLDAGEVIRRDGDYALAILKKR